MSETSQQHQPTTINADDAIVSAAFGEIPLTGLISPSQNLWGFGGLHGGLSLALLAQAMQQHVPNKQVVQISANFAKNIRGTFEIITEVEHIGRTAAHINARAHVGGQFLVGASAVFAEPAAPDSTTSTCAALSPPMPLVPPPEQCTPFHLPRTLVPFATRTDLRPTDEKRPFQGGSTPELTVWLRVKGDDTPVDFPRLAFLMDALAPSYTAVLTKPIIIPTVTVIMYPANPRAAISSPWILLRAETKACTEDGWIDEHLNAWSENGVFLGSASQRRLALQQS